MFFLGAIDAWSMLLWIAGVIWFFWGARVFWWSLPAVAFLWFMVPLPWRAERWLSLPLQTVATKISCWGLQCLGQPALAEGHTILLNTAHLEVEQACSGLRVFMGITALACAYLAIVRQTWWERAILLASVVPVALAANAARIVATGLFYRYTSDETAKRFSHDAAGWAMIVVAAGLFALVLLYLKHLFRPVEPVEIGDVLRRERTEAQPSIPV
jgi:exosortase